MSRPTLHHAVLLAADRLYRDVENSWEQSVLLDDLTRAVARIYGLPDQDPMQQIDEARLRDSKFIRPDGQKLDLSGSDHHSTLDHAVKSSALWLRNHGYVKLLTNNRLQLTEPGAGHAKIIAQSQLIVDAGIIERVQEHDPLKARQDDWRLKDLRRSEEVRRTLDNGRSRGRGMSR